MIIVKRHNDPATREIQIDDELPVCPICLQELLADCCEGEPQHEAVVTLHCGHSFHNICIFTWIEYKKKETKTNVFPCPYCKAKYVAYNNGSSFLIGKWRQNSDILRLFIFFVFLVTAAGVYITSLQNF
jgi:hypothetical protein